MVRKHNRDDKLTFDRPIKRQSSLVPWKELVTSPTVPERKNKTNNAFDFDNFERTPKPKNVEKPELEEIKDTESLSNESCSQIEGDDDKRNRKMSPMQKMFLQEHKWQGYLVELDKFLSKVPTLTKDEFNSSNFIKTIKNKEFLDIFFRLFDWEERGSIPQDKIINSARQTFQGHGGLEWVELFEVVAYVICEDREIFCPCFEKIFNSKGVVEKLYKALIKDSETKIITRHQIMDLIANLTYARPRKGFSAENLEQLEKMFREALGAKQELSFEDFKKIVHSRNSFFAERVFQIFDRDRSGSVSLSEFLDAMHQFTGKSPNDKIKFLFRVYDLDGDGLIQIEELEQVMKACMEENGMKFSHEQIEDLTLALFEDADTEGRGEITFEALKAQLEKHPGLLENLSISIDRWLVPPQTQVKKESFVEKLKKMRPYHLTLPYLKNNYVYLSFLLFFIGVNVGLFVDRALTIYNQGHNIYYILARACGQCLNFNCSFVLIMVLRQCITFLRSHGAASFLPLDQHLYFHKMCGFVILFHSLLHTIMHLINFPLVIVPNKEINPNGYTAAQWLFTSTPGLFGLVPGWANPTGVVLVVVLLIMVVCSLPFVRKSGYFEVFYWTHLLYVAFWVLTILHGPHFWKWFIGPAVLFAIQKLYRWSKMRTGHGKTYICSGILLPSKVTHLVIQKPIGFHFSPGDYVFVNIPDIAKYEWHPFTISSAPEQEGAIWLHIRAVGEWTSRLYDYFEQQQIQCEQKRVTQKLSIQYSSDKKILVNVDEKELMEDEDQNNGKDSDQGGRKNGIVNISYEAEKKHVSYRSKDEIMSSESDLATGESEDVTMRSLNLAHKGFLNKKRIEKTKSVPDLDDRMKNRERNMLHRENWRNISAKNIKSSNDDEIFETADGQKMKLIHYPTNKSVAMSVRYMRRKPRVVTLDAPLSVSDSSEEEEEESEIEEGEETELNEADEEAPKPTAVIKSSGRIYDKKVSRVSSANPNRKSRQEMKKSQRVSRLKEAEVFGQCTVGKPLVVYIDGPYGAPSSHIFRAQHAVLIGTGIGVTPFASILQSIMHRYHKALQVCPRCDHAFTSEIPESVMYLRKVDFFWINRDQRSFEWFVNLLSQLEIEQAEQGGTLERFLDMHMYITSALQKTDMKAVGLQLALELLHEKEKRDLITGLKTRTNAGRPNWDKVFKQLSNHKKGKITVFYCGPPALARILKFKCDEYGFEFRKEIF